MIVKDKTYMMLPQIHIFFMLILVFLVCFNDAVLAQNVQVQGRVIDAETEESLAFANIALLNPTDSSVIYGGMSDERGRFLFTADQGNYILRAGFIGFTQFFKNAEISGSDEFKTGTIRLSSDATTLEAYYHQQEQLLNQESFQQAINRQGPDHPLTRMWIDPE